MSLVGEESSASRNKTDSQRKFRFDVISVIRESFQKRIVFYADEIQKDETSAN